MKKSFGILLILIGLSISTAGCFENRQPDSGAANYIQKPLYIELVNFKDTSVFLVKYTSPVVYFYNGSYYYEEDGKWKKTKFIGRPEWVDEPQVPEAIKTASTIEQPGGEQFLRRIGYRRVAIQSPEDYNEVFIYSYWDFSDFYFFYQPEYRSYRRAALRHRLPRHHRHRDGLSAHSGRRPGHGMHRPGREGNRPHIQENQGRRTRTRTRPHRQPIPIVSSPSREQRHSAHGSGSGRRPRREYTGSSGSSRPSHSYSSSSNSGSSNSRPSRRSRDYSSSSSSGSSYRPSYSGGSSYRPSYSSSSSSGSSSSGSSSRGSGGGRFRIR